MSSPNSKQNQQDRQSSEEQNQNAHQSTPNKKLSKSQRKRQNKRNKKQAQSAKKQNQQTKRQLKEKFEDPEQFTKEYSVKKQTEKPKSEQISQLDEIHIVDQQNANQTKSNGNQQQSNQRQETKEQNQNSKDQADNLNNPSVIYRSIKEQQIKSQSEIKSNISKQQHQNQSSQVFSYHRPSNIQTDSNISQNSEQIMMSSIRQDPLDQRNNIPPEYGQGKMHKQSQKSSNLSGKEIDIETNSGQNSKISWLLVFEIIIILLTLLIMIDPTILSSVKGILLMKPIPIGLRLGV